MICYESGSHSKLSAGTEASTRLGTVPGPVELSAPLLTHRTPAEAAPTRRPTEHSADRGRFQVVQPEHEADELHHNKAAPSSSGSFFFGCLKLSCGPSRSLLPSAGDTEVLQARRMKINLRKSDNSPSSMTPHL